VKIRNNYYDDYHDINDEMLTASTHCRRFSRRNDVNSFNMALYMMNTN
jgi:hypothetical protein